VTPQRQAATALLAKFPKAATMTLARTAYKEAPELWPNLDACRKTFRHLRGANGAQHRKGCSNKEHFREPQKSGDPFGSIPEPAKELEQWKIVHIPGPLSMLRLSDIHLPYHDREALTVALRYGHERNPSLVLLDGDSIDHYSLSKFEKDPRKKHFPEEVKIVREFLGIIRKAFPKARIIWKDGNHEERYISYMRVKAPELLGFPEFELQNVLKLDDYGVEYVTDRCPIKIGSLFFLHGHEYTFAISNPVNPARGLILRTIGVHAVCGHFHQTSQHSENNLEQKIIATWSTGCLCNLHPHWMPINKWGHGFMFADIDKAGAFQVNNLRIIDGKVWH
jgi:predicted phosphodiesterase